MINLLMFVCLVVFLYMSMWYLVSLVFKRMDVADLAWGLGFILISSLMAFISGSPISLFAFLLILVWGVRLASHIQKRILSRDEDRRYANWRTDWGKNMWWRSFLQTFMLQGVLMILISISAVILAYERPTVFVTSSLFGVLIWIVGYIFESVGDKQLADFVANPINKGKIMQSGLWKYSRHPNYFGEVTMWWGIFVIVYISTGSLWAIISPLTITILILFVSGVPLLERKYEGREDFDEYKRKTSVFIPWFSRK